ncbi:probable RNA-binding protein 19 isoform X4 [Scylla paramamosain]|uniref:probable RNA-binding protein 19 isoform X4 n=1 Tax=Scylla paramamosain TaxID=85552 RepID=UPI003082F00A
MQPTSAWHPAPNRRLENLSFKEEEAQEKVTVGSWHNWNTLFMGGSAMVDVMVRGYNRSKQDILKSEGKQCCCQPCLGRD